VKKLFSGVCAGASEGVESRAIQPQHGNTASSRFVRSLAILF
jgi:hypothetical protein